MIDIHYVDNFWNGSKPLCGAEFVDGETTAKEAVTCPVCLELLKKEDKPKVADMGTVNGVRLTYVDGNIFATPEKKREKVIKELLGGADSV